MPHKSNFTVNEANQIRNLISQKIKAPEKEQKTIRDQIRCIGFYYTDFRNERISGGYTVDDFNDLIESGEIVITE